MASIFTRIVNGEIPSYKVAEDDRFYAFLNINPLSEVTLSLFPKLGLIIFLIWMRDLPGSFRFCAQSCSCPERNSMQKDRYGSTWNGGFTYPHPSCALHSEGDLDFHRKISLTPERFKRSCGPNSSFNNI